MRILIVGNGGREHALLWKLRRDAPDAEFFVTRPNGGMTGCTAVDVAPTDVTALVAWAEDHRPDLTVVGPEAPLAAGLVDRLQEAGLAAFGPTAAAARIEASKAYAKALMERAGVPTASYRSFSDPRKAEAWIRTQGAPIVVKASGLAAGKGAVVCHTVDQALDAVRSMMAEGDFGDAGNEVVIEAFMEGEELSVFGVCDGERALLLLASQDHKAVGEGDTGPNTGGMGAYAPVSIATTDLMEEARTRVFAPTLAALAEDGAPFRGLLYAGLMKTDDGLRVVEFNCRFGDPETQVVLPLMRSSLLDLVRTVAVGGSLEGRGVVWRDQVAVTTVVASGGYPGGYRKGMEIHVPDDLEGDGMMVFHAGTVRTDDGSLVTSGGRVLAVTAVAERFADAADRSRKGAGAVDFEHAFFRPDIGWRERARRTDNARSDT